MYLSAVVDMEPMCSGFIGQQISAPSLVINLMLHIFEDFNTCPKLPLTNTYGIGELHLLLCM